MNFNEGIHEFRYNCSCNFQMPNMEITQLNYFQIRNILNSKNNRIKKFKIRNLIFPTMTSTREINKKSEKQQEKPKSETNKLFQWM